MFWFGEGSVFKFWDCLVFYLRFSFLVWGGFSFLVRGLLSFFYLRLRFFLIGEGFISSVLVGFIVC